MSYQLKRAWAILVILCLSLIARPAWAQPAMVHGVLFYSPSCPHCHEVMEQHLPPLVAQYPGQLDIVGVDVDHEVGANLYQAMLAQFNVPDDRIGVPTLVVGNTVLVGSIEIPEQLPGIIANGLTAGGIDWPAIPGLLDVLAAQPEGMVTYQAPAVPAPQAPASMWDKFMQEPVENTLATIILLLMVASVLLVAFSYIQGWNNPLFNWPRWAIPVLSVIGMGIAGYLSYTYLTGGEVICGPSGGCSNVQNSEYAYLFGIIPVGLLGLLGYIAILAAWLIREYGSASFRKLATLAIWGFAWFGTLFTIYLTFLEPFVIGASCLWCLGSAVVMTLMFLAATGPALEAMRIEASEMEDELEDQYAGS